MSRYTDDSKWLSLVRLKLEGELSSNEVSEIRQSVKGRLETWVYEPNGDLSMDECAKLIQEALSINTQCG